MTRPSVIALAQRLKSLGANSVLETRVHARRMESLGHDIIHLDLGEPDFPTPSHIVEAGLRSLHAGATACAPPSGIPELREAIAESMSGRGMVIGPENVLVTSGSTPMLFYAITGAIESGDEVLVPDPATGTYDSMIHFAEGTPVRYAVDPSRTPAIDLQELERAISPRTRVLILNSPHNPTGVVLDLPTLAGLADLALRHNLTVVSDEVYAGVVYGSVPPSIAALPGMPSRTIVVDGFSKTYAMAGWRLGFGIVPATVARRFEHFVTHTTNSAPLFVQRAGVAALRGSQECVRTMCMELRARRDLLVAALNRMPGVSCRTPRGTFYVFPEFAEAADAFGVPDERYATRLADKLLVESGVACVPGTAFGSRGAGHLRLSFVAPPGQLLRAADMIQRTIANGTEAESAIAAI